MRKCQKPIDKLADAACIGADDMQQPLAFGVQLVRILLHQHARESVNGAKRPSHIVGNGVREGFQLFDRHFELRRAFFDAFLQLDIQALDLFSLCLDFCQRILGVAVQACVINPEGRAARQFFGKVQIAICVSARGILRSKRNGS